MRHCHCSIIAARARCERSGSLEVSGIRSPTLTSMSIAAHICILEKFVAQSFPLPWVSTLMRRSSHFSVSLCVSPSFCVLRSLVGLMISFVAIAQFTFAMTSCLNQRSNSSASTCISQATVSLFSGALRVSLCRLSTAPFSYGGHASIRALSLFFLTVPTHSLTPVLWRYVTHGLLGTSPSLIGTPTSRSPTSR